MRKIKLFLTLLLAFVVQVSFAQEKVITGTVSDESGPLPGVNVVVKGTTKGTQTDFDGKFVLKNVKKGDVIVFSYVGMATVNKKVGNGKVMNVKMKSENTLGEVMVVAYGTAKKASFTGSASQVKADDIQKTSVSNVSKAIEGSVSGVQVSSGSGQPGQGVAIRIRGIGSINASASPLIVVDGFPYSGGLNSIETSDIESFNVLKDASATALYGSRAANGVIIITTKKGKNGKSEFEFKTSVGIVDRAFPEYETVSAGDYYKLTWEGLKNSNGGDGAKASAELIKKLGNYNIYRGVPNDKVVLPDGTLTSSKDLKWNDSWQKEMFRKGIRKSHTLSASIGTSKSKYYISANYLNAEGIIQDSKFDRYSARMNVESELKDWVKVNGGLVVLTTEQNFPVSSGSGYVNSFMYSRMVAPIYPVYLYDEKGNLQYDSNGAKKYDYGNLYGRNRKYSSNSNPLGTIGLDKRVYKNDIASARASVDFKLLEGLNFKLSASADYIGYNGLTHQNALFGDAASFKGRSTKTSSRSFSFVSNQLLTYKKQIDEHNFDLLVGHESSSHTYNILTATRTGFPGPDLYELDVAAVPEGSGSRIDKLTLESYLSRLNYDYSEKYYLSASFRTDGSSRFHPDVRWGKFWSVGTAWMVTKEDFMASTSDWLTNLKLKASYGVQGNDRLGTYYAYLGTFNPGYSNLKEPGLVLNRLATPDLTWEKNNSWNFGLETDLFDRVSVNFEYFIRESDDLLFTLPLPLSTGVSGISANIGAIKNSGFETELGLKIFDTNDFKWNLSVNATHYKNEITELPQKEIIDGDKKWEVGHSVYDFYLRKYAGVDSETGKPQWFKDEKDEQGKIKQVKTDKYSSATRYYTGDSSIPDFMGGLTNEFSYKGFELSTKVSYAFGGKVYDYSYASLMGGGSEFGTNWHKDMLNRWTPESKNTNVPIIHSTFSKDANASSDRFLTDASFVNIKNVSLSYDFSKKMVEKFKLQQVKIYTSVDNLYLWSKRQGMDPQQSLSGSVSNEYTPVRTFSLGVNVKF